MVLLCATFVFSATLWLETRPEIPTQRHREHKGCTKKIARTFAELKLSPSECLTQNSRHLQLQQLGWVVDHFAYVPILVIAGGLAPLGTLVLFTLCGRIHRLED